MFTKKQSMATAGVVTTVGATFALGTFGTAPATAAQLDFNFVTDKGTGSFTLNTSTLDSNPSSTAGFFPSAITNLQYSGLGRSASGEFDLTTGEGSDNFQPISIWRFPEIDDLSNGDDYFTFQFEGGDLINQLSDNPNDYSLRSRSNFGIIIFPDYRTNFGGPDYGGSLTVSVVPEPLTILGSGLAIGFGALFQREYSRRQKKTKA